MKIAAVATLMMGLAGPCARASAEPGDLRLAWEQAQAAAGAHRQAAFDGSMAEARLVMSLLEGFAGEMVYFPGMYRMSDEPFTVAAGRGPSYEAVSRRIPFLAVPPGTMIVVRPGAQRAAWFAELKADYFATLLRAGRLLEGLDAPSVSRVDYRGYVDWGSQTIVLDPAEGRGADYRPVLTQDQRAELLRTRP